MLVWEIGVLFPLPSTCQTVHPKSKLKPKISLQMLNFIVIFPKMCLPAKPGKIKLLICTKSLREKAAIKAGRFMGRSGPFYFPRTFILQALQQSSQKTVKKATKINPKKYCKIYTHCLLQDDIFNTLSTLKKRCCPCYCYITSSN